MFHSPQFSITLNCTGDRKIIQHKMAAALHPNSIGGIEMVNKNDSKDMRKNAPKQSGQPEPLSGSKKVKNRNHTRQKHNSHHDM